MKSEKFNLMQYSAISACFLTLHQYAMGQAVYTDIDPDIVLDSDNESAGVDMDNSGTFDFAFINRTGSFSTYSSNDISYFEVINVGPQTPNNSIAGQIHIISPSYGGSWIYLPFALGEGSSINNSILFYNEGYQVMAYRYIQTDGDYFPKGGIWYPEVLDHYLGVRFIDTSDCQHYGWIRCDIKDNGRTLVIKDYAYEIKCNTGIFAGDIIGDTTTVSLESFNLLYANIYAFNSDVYVQLNEKPGNYSIRITNLSGALIYSDLLRNKWNVISLINEPEGLYFIEIFAGQKKLVVKKIFIN